MLIYRCDRCLREVSYDDAFEIFGARKRASTGAREGDIDFPLRLDLCLPCYNIVRAEATRQGARL